MSEKLFVACQIFKCGVGIVEVRSSVDELDDTFKVFQGTKRNPTRSHRLTRRLRTSCALNLQVSGEVSEERDELSNMGCNNGVLWVGIPVGETW